MRDLLGAVLSRAVVGASPFFATVAASAVLALLHRLLALSCIRWKWLEDLVSGREIEIIRDGRLDRDAMKKALLTERNVTAAVRRRLGDQSFENVALLLLERDGTITVIGKTNP